MRLCCRRLFHQHKAGQEDSFFVLKSQIQACGDNTEGHLRTDGYDMPKCSRDHDQTPRTEAELHDGVHEKEHRGDIVVYELPAEALTRPRPNNGDGHIMKGKRCITQ